MVKKKKKAEEASVRMDSFLDILTCLVGVLVLIIILTSIDASQTKVLISTPMAKKSDHRQYFIECRNNELFPIKLEAMRAMVDEKFEELDKTLTGDPEEMKETLKSLTLETEDYLIDTAYVLVGSIAVSPRPGVKGDDLSKVEIDLNVEGGLIIPGWFGKLLQDIDKDNEKITFLVRDDSFDVFKKARALVWNKKVNAAYELWSVGDPIIFGLGGDISLSQ